MNKKSLLMMMVTICLIAVVGVGATLAYLSDVTDVKTNTFTLGKVDIELDEPNYVEPDDIVPGQEIEKDPTVKVKMNSVDSYVYMSVKGIDNIRSQGFTVEYGERDEAGKLVSNSLKEGLNPAWKKIENEDSYDGIYVYSDENGNPKKALKSDKDVVLPALFDLVTYSDDVEKNDGGEFYIYVKAAAIQADVVEKNDEACIEALEEVKANLAITEEVTKTPSAEQNP